MNFSVFVLLSVCFHVTNASTTILQDIKDTFNDYQFVSQSDSGNLPLSAMCESGKTIVWGFTYHLENFSGPIPQCVLDSNSACTVGASSCSVPSCSSNAGVHGVSIVCGTPIPGSVAVSQAYASGSSQQLKCPTSKGTLFGFKFQYGSNFAHDNHCQESNLSSCPFGAVTCETTACSMPSSIQFIFLLCGNPSEYNTLIKNADYAEQITRNGGGIASECNQYLRNDFVTGVGISISDQPNIYFLAPCVNDCKPQTNNSQQNDVAAVIKVCAISAGLTNSPIVGSTSSPANVPTNEPTNTPTDVPTNIPTDVPTNIPTDVPTNIPTNVPTNIPNDVPTNIPNDVPTNTPIDVPTKIPTSIPILPGTPTTFPTDASPSFNPTTTQDEPPTQHSETSNSNMLLFGAGTGIAVSLVAMASFVTYYKRKPKDTSTAWTMQPTIHEPQNKPFFKLNMKENTSKRNTSFMHMRQELAKNLSRELRYNSDEFNSPLYETSAQTNSGIRNEIVSAATLQPDWDIQSISPDDV